MNTDRHDLERQVTDELTLAESSRAEEVMHDPVTDWQFDPTEVEPYEALLHSLLGAAEALDERSPHEAQGQPKRQEDPS